MNMAEDAGYEIDLQDVHFVTPDDPSVVQLPEDESIANEEDIVSVANTEDAISKGNRPLGRRTSRKKLFIGVLASAAVIALALGISIGVGTKNNRSNVSSAASAVTLEQCLAAKEEYEYRTASIEEDDTDAPTYVPTSEPTDQPTDQPTVSSEETEEVASSDEWLDLTFNGFSNDVQDGPVRRELRGGPNDEGFTLNSSAQESNTRKEKMVQSVLQDVVAKNRKLQGCEELLAGYYGHSKSSKSKSSKSCSSCTCPTSSSHSSKSSKSCTCPTSGSSKSSKSSSSKSSKTSSSSKSSKSSSNSKSSKSSNSSKSSKSPSNSKSGKSTSKSGKSSTSKSSKSKTCDEPTPRPTSSPSPPTLPPMPPVGPPVTTSPIAPSNTVTPTTSPSKKPTGSPTQRPTSSPSKKPTGSPTMKPTTSPSKKPTGSPSKKPSSSPTTSSPTLTVGCETAYGWDNTTNSLCFTSIPDLNSNRWGWTNGVGVADGVGNETGYGLNTTVVLALWAGAAQCDFSIGRNVGTVTFDYNAMTVRYTLSPGLGLFLSEVQVWVGNTVLPIKNGDLSSAPGGYNNVEGNPGVNATDFLFDPLAGYAGNVYVAAHATVCPTGS